MAFHLKLAPDKGQASSEASLNKELFGIRIA